VKTKVPRWVRWLIRAGVSAGLLLWLFSRYDLKGILATFEGLPISVWLLASLIYLICQVMSSIRWWVLSNTLAFPGRWPTYLGFYFVGMYFNLFLPTGIGGDVFKAHFLSRDEGRRVMAAWSVLGDRLSGLITMLLIGAGVVMIEPDLLPEPVVFFLFISALIILCGLAGFPFFHRALMTRWPGLSRYVPDLLKLWQRPGRMAVVLGLSFSLQALGMGAVALLGAGIGIQIPPAFYFAVIPVIALMIMIPISFSGIGVREGAFVYFLGLKGVDAESAVSLGLLWFSIQVAISLVGGLAYAFGVHRRSVDSA
jgi:uncharacterized membrane protein YbhN (UPF0104 family)